MLSHADIQAAIDALYKGVDGYDVSAKDRTGALEMEKSYVYGEIMLGPFHRMLEWVSPQADEVFYDLGSGLGKTVFMAHWLFPFARATGIEFLPCMYSEAEKALQRYEENIRQSMPISRGQVAFRHADLASENIADADVIFTYCLCFSEELQEQLQNNLQTCRPGTRIIAAGGIYHAPWLVRVHEMEYTTPWDSHATCYIYHRK